MKLVEERVEGHLRSDIVPLGASTRVLDSLTNPMLTLEKLEHNTAEVGESSLSKLD